MAKVITKRDKRQWKSEDLWDKAISDAERGIERLKLAIKTCREKKEAGELWPRETSKQN